MSIEAPFLLRPPGAISNQPRRERHRTAWPAARIQSLLAIFLFGLFALGETVAAEKTFTLDGQSITLQEVTGEAEVYYRSMRFNRPLDSWNVEVSVTNRGSVAISGPLLLLVLEINGSTGLVGPDGMDDSVPSLPFLDLSPHIPGGVLLPGQGTSLRTLTLGRSSSTEAPSLVTAVYALPQQGSQAAALTRTLSAAGVPLDGVSVESIHGAPTASVDAGTGLVTLNLAPGENTWKFFRDGYTPAWRKTSGAGQGVQLLAAPRLTLRSTNEVTLTPLNGGALATPEITISFAPGQMLGVTSATLTPLTAQSLPALLPPGWSPLQAFWFEAGSEPVSPGTALVQLWGSLLEGDSAALVRWNESALGWEVVENLEGRVGESLDLPIPASGAYAVVAGDRAPLPLPPAPVPGKGLAAAIPVSIDTAILSAQGEVKPASSPANRNPNLVTAQASVVITSGAGPLSSGTAFIGELTESYYLRDGSERHPPRYEQSLIGYQRPGDENPATLELSFPMRPLLLFGAEELDEAILQADVLPPATFDGMLLGTAGGQVQAGRWRILVGSGALGEPQAFRLRELDPGLFQNVTGAGSNLVAAFELDAPGIVSGHRLAAQFSGLPANGLFVLARVLVHQGITGLEPVERYRSGSDGRLVTLEPAEGDRLPGIFRSGQYVLVQVEEPHGVVKGVARDAEGNPAAGLFVRIANKPWAVLSRVDGLFYLVAPIGETEVILTDLFTGDSATAGGPISSGDTVLPIDAAVVPSGPTVFLITPVAEATNVPRVTAVEVVFSEPISPATLGASGIALFDPDTQLVTGSLSLNLSGTVATLLPNAQLAPDTRYTILVSTGITDVVGLPLEGTRQFSFTTESSVLDRGSAQLIIYEPGATNVPPAILDDIPAYEPGTDPFAIVVHGEAGVADPEAAVVLLNESTGETATVLSKADGSFSSLVPGTADDFVSATFVNQNGTRVYVPVSRQEFDNGFVGLYPQGGILEAESDGGPVQVLVEPGAIPGKSRFKIDALSTAEVLVRIGNTQPEQGQLLGGIDFEVDGDTPEVPVDIEFPVDPDSLNLELGEAPEDRTFALCRAIETDGVTVFEILDRMHYEDGRLITRSPPFPGPPHLNFLAIPLMMAFGTTSVIAGQVVSVPESFGYPTEAQIMAGVPPIRRVPGAIVSASPGAPSQGPLRRGAFISRANTLGFFSFLYPVNQLDPEAVLIRAQDVRFPGIYGFTALPATGATAGAFAAQSANVVIRLPEGVNGDSSPPVVTAFPPVVIMPVGTNVTVEFNLRDNLSDPILNSVTFLPEESVNTVTGAALVQTNLAIEIQAGEVQGPGRLRVPVVFNATEASVVTVQAGITDTSGNARDVKMRFRFGSPLPASEDNLPPGDLQDETPPQVVSTNPIREAPVVESFMTFRFNEPVDKGITNVANSISIFPTVEAFARLAPDQQTLTLFFRSLEPGTDYAVTLNAASVQDLSGNAMDESYQTVFRTAEARTGPLSGISASVGSVMIGSFAFSLNRVGLEGELIAHQVGDANQNEPAHKLRLPFFPRVITAIPSYDFVLSTNGPVQTNRTLVAVAGGVVGAETIGQLLWIVDVSDPWNMRRIASEVIEVDPAALVAKMTWSPPSLVLGIARPDFPLIELANLQAFLIGANQSVNAVAYQPGTDANGDGDFVDPDDVLPVPERNTFYGLELVLPLEQDASLIDFDVESGGGYLVATLRLPATGATELQVLTFNGQPIAMPGRSEGKITFADAYARRVVLDMGFPVETDAGLRILPAAIVAVDHELRIYDLTDPAAPELLNTITLETDAESIFTITRSGPDEYAVGTSEGIFILQRSLMSRALESAEVSPAVVGFYGGSVHGRTMGVTDLEIATTGSGSPVMINRPPRLRIVQFPGRPVTSIEDLLAQDQPVIDDYLANQVESPFLMPLLLDVCDTNAPNPLADPANPAFHHYALVRANGLSGPEIRVTLESLGLDGRLNPPPGKDYGPVILTEHAATLGLDAAQPEVHALVARRLSDNPLSDLYNTYLADPFLVVRQPLTSEQVAQLQASYNRQFIWSGEFIRVSIDGPPNGQPALEPWTSEVTSESYLPSNSRTYYSLRPEYIDNPNPSFALAAPRLKGVDLQSGEFRHVETDVYLEGRELDLVLTRYYESRGRFSGPFGRGWDFSLNVRLLELEELILPPGLEIPLGVDPSGCLVAGPGDVILYDGAGGVHRFHRISEANGNLDQAPAYSSDPAIQEFLGANGADLIDSYYESPNGLFTVLYKFKDGGFMTVGPSGSQMYFDATGRITKMRGTSAKAELLFSYREDGKLDRVEGDRGIELEFGYYLRFPGPDFQLADVASDDASELGKIARVRFNPSLAHALEVEYFYDENGNLERVKPNAGEETVIQYDAGDLNLVVGVGFGDGTKLPGQAISYNDNGLVESITRDGQTSTFAGAKSTAAERFATGPATVSMTTGPNTVEIDIDARGRPTSMANRPFAANDQGLPTLVANVEDEVDLVYDTANEVYRFRGNLLRTERTIVGGSGMFVTTIDYDGSAYNRPETIEDVNGVTTEITSTLTKIIERVGPVTKTVFLNNYGQMVREENEDELNLIREQRFSIASLSPDGGLQIASGALGMNEHTVSRDDFGRIETVSGAGGTYTIAYNDDGQPKTISGSGIPSVSLGYTDGLKTTETISAAAQQIRNSYTYDQTHKTAIKTYTTTETGLPVSATTYTYDERGRVEKFEADGETTRFTYDGLNILTMRGPGVARAAVFDGPQLNSLTEQGVETTFGYDTAARLEEMEVAGATTTFEYDDAGSILRERLKRKVISLEGQGDVLDETYAYDAAGRVQTIIALGQTRQFTYFPDGMVRSMTLNGETVRDVSRNQAGLVTSSRVQDVQYDYSGHDGIFGLPASEVMTLLPSSTTLIRQNRYDTRGRLDQVTLPSGSTTFTYDGFGHQDSTTDPDQVVWKQTFAPSGLPLSRTFADGDAISYRYNAQRRADQITGGGLTQSFSYDSEGLVRQIDYPDGAVTRFENRNSFFEPDKVINGGVEQNLTWVEGRLRAIAVPATGDALSYEKDGWGRIHGVTLNGHTTTFGFNLQGVQNRETSPAGTWAATFDAVRRLQAESYPSGLTISYAPDSFGLATSATALGIQAVNWIGVGLPNTITYTGGLKVQRHYDPSLRLETITYSVGQGTGMVVAGFDYDLSAGGRILAEERLHGGGFDLFQRSSAAEAVRITNFVFGAESMDGSQPRFTNSQHRFEHGELFAPAQGTPAEPRSFFPAVAATGPRLSTVDDLAVSYSSFGSVTAIPLWVPIPGRPGVTRVAASLDYDGLGMLRRVVREDGVTVRYVRDGLGRIVEREVTGSPANCRPGKWRYAWKGTQLIEEWLDVAGSWELVRRYGYLGLHLVTIQSAATPGGAMVDHVPLLAGNGSVRGYLSPNGTLLEKIEYSPYGVPVFEVPGDDLTREFSSIGNTLLFHGAFYDEATGLYQMGQRNLHPVIGRFLQRDNVIFSQSLALFTAFNGDPAGKIDPFGTDPLSTDTAQSGLARLKEKKQQAKDLGEKFKAFTKLHGTKLDASTPFAVAGVALDLMGSATDFAGYHPELELKKQAEQYSALAGLFKNGMDVLNAVQGTRTDRSALATATVSVLDLLGGSVPGLKRFSTDGATIDPAVLKTLDDHFENAPASAYPSFAASQAEDLHKNLKEKSEAYYDNRTGNLLSIGKGVNQIAKTIFNWAHEGDETHAVKTTQQAFNVIEKGIDAAEKYREARKADDLAMMFLTRHNLTDISLSKSGRSAVSAAFQAGFEAGKLAIMFFADEHVAKAYTEQVKQFDENGGWLTVAGGIFATVGMDDTAYLLQQYSDFKAGDLVKPLLEERARNLQRTQYYLNGISAP